MASGGGKGGGGGGSSGPSPFDLQAAQFGEQQSIQAMTNTYQQLGLGQTGATPTSPGNFGSGSTAMQMDIGQLPSLTGGIPEQFAAMLGELENSELGSSGGGGGGGGGKGGGGKGGLGSLGKLAMGGK